LFSLGIKNDLHKRIVFSLYKQDLKHKKGGQVGTSLPYSIVVVEHVVAMDVLYLI